MTLTDYHAVWRNHAGIEVLRFFSAVGHEMRGGEEAGWSSALTAAMQRLKTLPEIGLILAVSIALEICDITWFATCGHMTSCAGNLTFALSQTRPVATACEKPVAGVVVSGRLDALMDSWNETKTLSLCLNLG